MVKLIVLFSLGLLCLVVVGLLWSYIEPFLSPILGMRVLGWNYRSICIASTVRALKALI
jgi:hypothetical protein